jgi:hypothetical protein
MHHGEDVRHGAAEDSSREESMAARARLSDEQARIARAAAAMRADPHDSKGEQTRGGVDVWR